MTGRAVIVGAGIGGLCTALGLHRAGWSVTVLERWPEVVGLGAALGVWPDAAKGLADVGLGEAFAAASVPVSGAGVYRADGRPLLTIRAGSRRVPPVRLVSRRRLMDLLVEACSGIEIRTGVTADEAVLRAATDDGAVLIGADGLDSAVRPVFFGTTTRPRDSGMIGWRGSVDFESGAYGETWGRVDGTGALFGNTPMEPGRTNFYAAVPAVDDPGSLDALRERFAGWHDPIPRILAAADPDSVLRNPIHDLHPPLPSFVAAGSVALLGDAAHAMTPNVGRGACEAILDAASLTRHLTDGSAAPAALTAYDRERRRPAQRTAARSWRMMRVSRASGVGAALRDSLVRTAGLVLR